MLAEIQAVTDIPSDRAFPDPDGKTDRPDLYSYSSTPCAFAVGLILEESNIALAFLEPPGSVGGDGSPVERVINLLPPARATEVIVSHNPRLAEVFRSIRRDALPLGFSALDLRRADEPVISSLAAALLASDPGEPSGRSVFADAIGTILATRLGRSLHAPDGGRRRPKGQLPKWRMKRVVEYVEDHLGDTITLGHIAGAAKLTQMHFAAQFRATTGIRPHEYLLRSRIDRARSLLLDSNESIIDIALTVGFQTQSHFTTVFRRFVGETPSRWREAQLSRRVSAAQPRGREPTMPDHPRPVSLPA